MARHTRAATVLERHLLVLDLRRAPRAAPPSATRPKTVHTLVLPQAKRRGVVYAPGTLFHADGRRSSSLRLTVGAAAPDALERGIRALGDAARDAVPRRRAGRPAVERVAIHVGAPRRNRWRPTPTA